MMPADVRRYFEEAVAPFLEDRFPELAAEAMVLVEGSAGLGLHDRWSDLDATIYLEDKLWKASGGSLQLALMHEVPRLSQFSEPHCSFPGQPHRWAVTGHPEICVHPVSWLLDHRATRFLARDQEPPWEEVSIERFYALQHDLILRDPRGVLASLRDAASSERFPEFLWRKHLISRLNDLKGEPWDLQKAVRRQKPIEAAMVLGPLLQALLEICFLIESSYYPWRKHLWQAFAELPIAAVAGPQIAEAATASTWEERAEAIDGLVAILADAAVQRGVLTSEMIEFLPQAKSGKAWSNPNWMAEYRRLASLARAAGYDEQDGWVWGLWQWA